MIEKYQAHSGYQGVTLHGWHNFNRKPTLGFYILSFIVVLLILYGMSKWQGKTTYYPNGDPQSGAWNACLLFLKDLNNLSPADAQTFNPEKVSFIGNNQYKAEIQYPKLSKMYFCTTQLLDDKWKLITIEEK